MAGSAVRISARYIRLRSHLSVTPSLMSSRMRCMKRSRSCALLIRCVCARSESAGTTTYMGLYLLLSHSCRTAPHVTTVKVPRARAVLSLSYLRIWFRACCMNVTACSPAPAPFVCRTAMRTSVSPQSRAESQSAGTATSPSSTHVSRRNSRQRGTRMSPSSHHLAKSLALIRSFRQAFLAAEREHCGSPPPSPVRLASPLMSRQGSICAPFSVRVALRDAWRVVV